jgi:hypothetical protein
MLDARKLAEAIKVEGNQLFQRKKYGAAIEVCHTLPSLSAVSNALIMDD